jgi:hypothetical protein
LSQGRYAYAIAITRIGPGGGYEWKVIRTQDAGIARRGAAPEIPALVCHGTAKTCDEAQRKSLAARRTIMGQRREADAPR